MRVLEYMAFAFPQVWVTHFPASGRSARDAAIFKRLGVRAGMPDLLLYWEHGHGMIELKSAGGYLSDTQKETQGHLIRCGVKVATCRSVDEVKTTLISWGISCKERVPTNLGRGLKSYEAFRPA